MENDPLPYPPYRGAKPKTNANFTSRVGQDPLYVTRFRTNREEDWENCVVIWSGAERPHRGKGDLWTQTGGRCSYWHALDFYEHFGWLPTPGELKMVLFATVIFS